MPQKKVSNLLFNIDRMHMEQVTEFNFLGPTIDSNLNWKAINLTQLALQFQGLLRYCTY